MNDRYPRDKRQLRQLPDLKPGAKLGLLLVVIVGILLPIYMIGPDGGDPPPYQPTYAPPIEYPIFDTLPVLAPPYQDKLIREIRPYIYTPKPHLRGQVGEVYALIVIKDGWYPCYCCGKLIKIYLKRGEIWKYGESTKGRERYSQTWLDDMGLTYRQIYQGPLIECKILEKVLIYHYHRLPENTNRSAEEQIPRPPGNKIYR